MADVQTSSEILENQELTDIVEGDPLVVADMISNYRRKIGLSQVECEREIGVSHSTWSDWETGKRLPTVGMCRRLAMLLRVDLETLIRACHPEVIKVMEIIEAKRRGQAA